MTKDIPQTEITCQTQMRRIHGKWDILIIHTDEITSQSNKKQKDNAPKSLINKIALFYVWTWWEEHDERYL